MPTAAVPHVTAADVAGRVGWPDVVAALRAGHELPRARVADAFVGRGGDTLLSRAAWVDGLGMGTKTVSVLPDNPSRELPSVQGALLLFGEDDGALRAVVDGPLLTDWKTAADTALAASLLARPDSRVLLVVGAGQVAGNLVDAYRAVLPGLDEVLVWNRTPHRAARLVERLRAADHPASHVTDLPAAVGRADVVATATFATDPVLAGAWVTPGTHVDLVGAFTPEMREADDALVAGARLFVDCVDTTVDHIGELLRPLDSGAITREDVLGDLYDLVGGAPGRTAEDDVTVCKNGGGAHLDLMTAVALLDALPA